MNQPGPQADSPKRFWNPQTGMFDPVQLRQAIVLRGWTVREFGEVAQVSRGCLYSALLGCGVTDRTAIRIFQAMAQRQPLDLAL